MTEPKNKEKKPRVSAVIVAAGSGTRMGGVSKPLIKLGKITVFERVLNTFTECDIIDEIVVVCRERQPLEELASKYTSKPIVFTAGGKTRGESVMNGVTATASDSDFVAIHDCARPFVTVENITDVVTAAFKSGAACACTAAADTIKYVNREQNSVYTPDREFLRIIQTPQVFKKDIYVVSSALARRDRLKTTDDTAAAEYAGFYVEYVECSSANFKLTTPNDIRIAMAMTAIENMKKKKTESEESV